MDISFLLSRNDGNTCKPFSILLFRGYPIFILNTFIAILISKTLHYNNNIKVFVNMTKINALNEKIAALSITDELTKLNNRRAFLDYMDIVWNQSHRLKLPLSVLILDVDFFKNIMILWDIWKGIMFNCNCTMSEKPIKKGYGLCCQVWRRRVCMFASLY